MEDIPKGLATLDKILFTGWVLILTIVDWIEVLSLQTKPREFSGDYELSGSFDTQSRVWTTLTAAVAARKPQLRHSDWDGNP